MKAIFERKPSDFNLCEFEVVKTIRFPAELFETVLNSPLRDYDFIKEHSDLMYCDEQGVYHCLLLIGDGRTDGLLVESEGYDYCRYASYVPNISGLVDSLQTPRLKDLLGICWNDVHLVHKSVEISPCTIVELYQDTLTDAGNEAWADVLSAEVVSVCTGYYGLQMELDKVKPSRLEAFSSMLAGHCSMQDYETWVTEEDMPPTQTMK